MRKMDNEMMCMGSLGMVHKKKVKRNKPPRQPK